MTLSLDEVRSIRFPLARKPNEDGYRASSVDKFMDDLEVSYAQLTEELDKLKQGGAATGSDDAKVSELTSQIEDLTGSNKKLTSDVERLTGENEQLRGQLNELRTSGGRDSAANQQLTTENEHLRNELEGLRSQLSEAQSRAAQNAAAATASQPIVSADGEQHITRDRFRRGRRLGSPTARDGHPAGRSAGLGGPRTGRQPGGPQQCRCRAHALRGQDQGGRQVEEATQKAARLDYESRNNAERITGDAQRRADNLDSEVAAKRTELFQALEVQRDQLADRIKALRGFESDYRTTIKNELESSLSRFSKLSLSPESEDDSPRLHALLEDRKSE